MKFYLLRDIPDELWIRVKQRAAKEGRSLRFVVLKLLGRYAQIGLSDDEKTARRRDSA